MMLLPSDAIVRHLLLLTTISPLLPLLLSSIEKLPKLVPRRRRRLAAGFTATLVDAVDVIHRHPSAIAAVDDNPTSAGIATIVSDL